jgi:hypothetical protein
VRNLAHRNALGSTVLGMTIALPALGRSVHPRFPIQPEVTMSDRQKATDKTPPAEARDESELSDEALESVAGGVPVPPVGTPILSDIQTETGTEL